MTQRYMRWWDAKIIQNQQQALGVTGKTNNCLIFSLENQLIN